MNHVMVGGMLVSDILYGLLSLIVLMIGAWCRSQETKIRDLSRENEKLRREMTDKWLKDANDYVNKADFHTLANDLKSASVRIEDKIEKLRGS